MQWKLWRFSYNEALILNHKPSGNIGFLLLSKKCCFIIRIVVTEIWWTIDAIDDKFRFTKSDTKNAHWWQTSARNAIITAKMWWILEKQGWEFVEAIITAKMWWILKTREEKPSKFAEALIAILCWFPSPQHKEINQNRSNVINITKENCNTDFSHF